MRSEACTDFHSSENIPYHDFLSSPKLYCSSERKVGAPQHVSKVEAFQARPRSSRVDPLVVDLVDRMMVFPNQNSGPSSYRHVNEKFKVFHASTMGRVIM
jgi:hypothetical protein